MDYAKELSRIKQRDDLARFVSALHDNLLQNPEEWDNLTLADSLGSMARWIEDTADPKAANYPIARTLAWRTFGEIMIAAKHYD